MWSLYFVHLFLAEFMKSHSFPSTLTHQNTAEQRHVVLAGAECDPVAGCGPGQIQRRVTGGWPGDGVA